MLLGIWWTFALTLSVFPETFNRSSLHFMEGVTDEKTWYNLIVLAVFNVTDSLGRALGGRYSLPDKAVPILALTRIIFFPITFYISYSEFHNEDWKP